MDHAPREDEMKEGLEAVKVLLEILTTQVPPREGSRHSITLVDETLEICLVLESGFLPVRLENSDYTLPANELAKQIYSVIEIQLR